MVDNRWSRQILRQLNYYQMFWLKPMLIKNAYEGIFIDHEGYVTEGSSSNIWIINKNNEILTREIDGKILSGITRKTISQFAKNNNFKMLEKNLQKTKC